MMEWYSFYVGYFSKIKVLLIGNSGVGKSCILHRYTVL